MKFVWLFLILIASHANFATALFGREYWQAIKERDNGGGAGCAACTIATSLIGQLSELHEKTVEEILDEICGYFPTEFGAICTYFVNTYGTDIIQLLESDLNADEVCHGIKLCSDPTCRMYPPSQQSKGSRHKITLNEKRVANINNKHKQNKLDDEPTLHETPWAWIEELIQRVSDHKPAVDFDGDLYSDMHTLRGANWRGADCNEGSASIYPGRRVLKGDIDLDTNCNGIYGLNSQGQSYEDLYCKGSGQFGVAVLGDSAGAHFEIPPAYMTASLINETTFNNLLDVLENEIDLPHKSGFTGFVPSSSSLMADSVYKRLVQRNQCNHRDFQNLGVNGARSGAMSQKLVQTLARNQTNDTPLLLFYELIGNDVCNPHPSFESMTTVEQFRENTLTSLAYLDTVLPRGSHVVIVGLADGLLLWDSLHNRTHPIGVTYKTVYDYLNCLQINPCWVWMNSNQTVRETGQKRANELSQVYVEILANTTWKNFDAVYYEFPFKYIIAEWAAKGGQTWQLIEPIDGFHPNQIAHSLMADFWWKTLLQDHPNFLGSVNPNNAAIIQKFGDQGGY